VLTLKHRALAPTVQFRSPNSRIPFGELNLAVVRELTTLPEGGDPTMVGVNSFGFGGTNAHVVLRSHPPLLFGLSPGAGA
jgi:phthiocerol/phenolphthiocerol synthesis type-I polyketide synthase C